MPGIAVKTLDTAGGMQLAGGQSFFKVEGELVVVVGDPVAGHGDPPHSSPVMVGHAPWFRIAGKGVCRAGDAASCGHLSTGRPWFRVG